MIHKIEFPHLVLFTNDKGFKRIQKAIKKQIKITVKEYALKHKNNGTIHS